MRIGEKKFLSGSVKGAPLRDASTIIHRVFSVIKSVATSHKNEHRNNRENVEVVLLSINDVGHLHQKIYDLLQISVCYSLLQKTKT